MTSVLRRKLVYPIPGSPCQGSLLAKQVRGSQFHQRIYGARYRGSSSYYATGVLRRPLAERQELTMETPVTHVKRQSRCRLPAPTQLRMGADPAHQRVQPFDGRYPQSPVIHNRQFIHRTNRNRLVPAIRSMRHAEGRGTDHNPRGMPHPPWFFDTVDV